MENEEEIIEQLEKLDQTVSKIKRLFKEIYGKTEIFKKQNIELVDNLQPFVRFFDLKDEKIENENFTVINSTIVKENLNSPFGPIKEIYGKNENAINNTFSHTRKENIALEETFINLSAHNIVNIEEDVKILEFESDSSSLTEFNLFELPAAFQKENLIEKLYLYIKNNGKVSLSKIYSFFDDKEKIDLFLSVLANKNFIKIKNNCTYTK
ncbi:hypothetical protein GVAV_003291 [Gurleya vavrai]